MSKLNVGAASVASLTLLSTLFVGSTAIAAGEQLSVTADSAGKELVVPAGSGINLKSFYNPGFSGTEANLKFKVVTDGEFGVIAVSGNFSSYVDVAATSAVVQTDDGGTIKSLYLEPLIDETQETEITVQAWEDSDGSETVDAGEWSSAPTSVKFIKKSDVTFTPTIGTLRPGAGSQDVEILVTSNVNLSQFFYGTGDPDASVGQELDGNGDPIFDNIGFERWYEDNRFAAVLSDTALSTSPGVDFALNNLVVPTYDSVDNNLVFVSSASDLRAGDKLSMKLYFQADNEFEQILSTWAIGIANGGDLLVPEAGANPPYLPVASSTYVVAPVTVSSVGAATVTASATASQTGTAATVIQTAGSFVVSSTVVASAGASAAGQTVTFTISETLGKSLVTGGSVSSGATILTNKNTGLIETKDVTAVTDADGKASITVTYAGLTNTDSLTNSFTITPKAQGVGGTAVTVTAASQTIGTIANTNVIGAGAQLVVAKDAAIDLTFGVVDVFGKPVTGAGYSVSVTQGSTTVVGSVVNGLATVTFPAYTTTGDRTLVAQGKKNGVDAGSPVNVLVTVGADTVANTLTYAGSNADHGVTTAIALNTEAAFVAADTRKGEVAAKTTAAALTTISGNVYTATGAGALTTVTLSGKGLDFVASGVYAKDSITVRTSATGSYSVEVRSSLSGTRTLTITSGAVVRTQNLIFATVSDQAGKTLTISSADKVSAGRSLRFAGKLVDKLGQPVTVTSSATRTFTVSYDGPGFVTSMPTSTDVNGNFFVNVLLGAGDTGLATLTATYDGDAAGSTYSTISAAKSVLVGVSASVSAGSKKANVVVKNASGLTVKVVSGSKSTTKTATSDSYKLSLSKLTSGSKTVKVYVNDVLVASKKVSVRR